MAEVDNTSRREPPPPVDQADTKQTSKADNQADKDLSSSPPATSDTPRLERETELGPDAESAPTRRPDTDATAADGREVFTHWQAKLGHPKAKLDGKRARAIRAALKLYSKDDLKRAVDGCSRSDFHMGRDPKTNGRRFDDIELICRDSKRIEGFMAMAGVTAAPRAHAQSFPRRDQPNQPNMGMTGLEIFQRQKAVTV